MGSDLKNVILGLVTVVASTCAIIVVITHKGAPDTTKARAERGREISPVALTIPNGVDKTLVYTGAYIANGISGCSDCHTWPNWATGHNPYLGEPQQANLPGFLRGGRPYVLATGTIVSPNITADAQGHPAGLTFDQFKQMLETCRDPRNPTVILQVMPCSQYKFMLEDDMKAVYSYLQSVPK